MPGLDNEFFDIMLDLETLGTVPGCAIVSVGAIAFNEFGVAERGFYRRINISEWDVPGLTEEGLLKDADTIEWWQKQSEEARAVFVNATYTTRQALSELALFCNGYNKPRVWGNGADFDNPIIAVAAHKVGLNPKNIWAGYSGRCYRTIKNQYKDVKLTRLGVYHNALDDARSQAEHMVSICRTRGLRLA